MAQQTNPVGAAVAKLPELEEPEGDPPARPDFTQLFASESSYVWSSLRRLGVREHDLEDLVHETFLVVHRHLHEFDPRRPIKPWLFGIAFRVAAGYRRLARTHREVPTERIEAIDLHPAADEMVEAKQAQALVTRALQSLDLDRRAILLMHEFDGHTVPQIAEVLAIPLNTAYSRLRLAREQFVTACRRLRGKRGGER